MNYKQNNMRYVRNLRRKSVVVAIPLSIFTFLYLSRNEFNKSSFSSSLILLPERNISAECKPEHPCSYSDKVDVRIIVITLKRPKSLLTLLNSLDVLELDGHSAALEIWIDRRHMSNVLDERTVKAASEFHWSRGPTRVHIHPIHVGLYGQWINTWRPRDDSNDELAMILEDDLSVSRYAYRWVRAVFGTYGQRVDFAGASLVGHQWKLMSLNRSSPLVGPKKHTVLMYKCFGWWGFAPRPMHWRRFQDWYHTHKRSVKPKFHPYVPGTLPTKWYKLFEKMGTTWTMWTMWFVYYMHVNKLYSVYSNLAVYTGSNQTSLTVNRLEAGLHYRRKRRANVNLLLNVWRDEFVQFPKDTVRIDWDGNYVPKNSQY